MVKVEPVYGNGCVGYTVELGTNEVLYIEKTFDEVVKVLKNHESEDEKKIYIDDKTLIACAQIMFSFMQDRSKSDFEEISKEVLLNSFN